jgi:hypothetical protein
MAVSDRADGMLPAMVMTPWWVEVIEDAVGAGRLPRVAAELAESLDALYRVVAIVYAEMPLDESPEPEDADARDLARLLGGALRRPSRYAWGPRLHASLRERLRLLFGSGAPPLPADWPGAEG